MTGVATLTREIESGHLDLEVRSVNHRFLKVDVRADGARLPRLDGLAEAAAKRHLERGHVTFAVRFQAAAEALGPTIDERAFAAAAEQLRDLAARHGLAAVTVRDVLNVPGVLLGRSEPDASLEAPLAEFLDAGVRALVVSRVREGSSLASVLESHIDRIAAITGEIAARADAQPTLLRDRLRARIAALLEGTGVALDPGSIEREAAALADRADVREELARLSAHVEHARDLVRAGGAAGKRLDFLGQELLREANTIGSKTPDLASTHLVLALKTEIERWREQVQNVE